MSRTPAFVTVEALTGDAPLETARLLLGLIFNAERFVMELADLKVKDVGLFPAGSPIFKTPDPGDDPVMDPATLPPPASVSVAPGLIVVPPVNVLTPVKVCEPALTPNPPEPLITPPKAPAALVS